MYFPHGMQRSTYLYIVFNPAHTVWEWDVKVKWIAVGQLLKDKLLLIAFAFASGNQSH